MAFCIWTLGGTTSEAWRTMKTAARFACYRKEATEPQRKLEFLAIIAILRRRITDSFSKNVALLPERILFYIVREMTFWSIILRENGNPRNVAGRITMFVAETRTLIPCPCDLSVCECKWYILLGTTEEEE